MFGKKKSGRVQQPKAPVAEKAASPVAATDEQLQNKIIAYFSNGQKIEAVPANGVAVTPEQRQRVVSQLAQGQISEREMEKFLQYVASPLHDGEVEMRQIFQEIIPHPKEKQILAVATGFDATNWQNLNEEDLKNFLERPVRGQIDYRTPVGFAKFRQKFLEGIRKQATPEQLASYVQAMDDLEKRIYGQRFAYYQQLEILKSSTPATATVASGEKTTPVEEVAIEEILAEEVKPEAEVSTARPTASADGKGLVPLAPERSNELLGRVIIEGASWQQNGAAYRLTVANLMSGGLTPAYEMEFEGRNLAFSDTFQLSDGRGAVLGYVATDQSVKLRSFYLNPKTGLWYYAPGIIRGARGEGMAQIVEGYGAASVMLPVVLQRQLCELARTRGFRELTMVNADFLFAGTMEAFNTQQEYREALERQQVKGDYYQEVDKKPIRENWQMTGTNKNVPQLISVNAEMAPDFQAPVAQMTSYSVWAGQIHIESFRSNDKQLIWVFCSDDWGRTWLGNIEVVSPVTSVGCRRDWMAAGDLVTPLYEHSTKAGGYGDANDTRKGMIGMWNQYLSKIPVIQEYIAFRKQRGQEG